jgi:peptidase E
VAGPDVSLAGWDPEWDQNIVNLTDTRGLDLVPFVISPHFDPEDLPLLRQKQSQVSYPVRPLADGQAIIVHNEHVRWVGVGSEVSL